MTGHGIHMLLKNTFGDNLIRGVQPVKTGFAICPSSQQAAVSLRNRSTDIEKIFHGSKVEEALNLNSYRLSAVPRSHTLFDGQKLVKVDTTVQAVVEALVIATGHTPTAVVQPRRSTEDIHSTSTTWILRYGRSVNSLPQSPIFFGTRTSIKALKDKSKTIQCGRCLLWHNERACMCPTETLHEVRLSGARHPLTSPLQPHTSRMPPEMLPLPWSPSSRCEYLSPPPQARSCSSDKEPEG